MAEITIALPIGPYEANVRWLPECLESIVDQTKKPDEVLVIDDFSEVKRSDFKLLTSNGISVRIWKTPWLSGVAHAFNFAVGLAKNNLVFLMGSDDWLEPACLEKCHNEWEKNARQDAYYYTGIRYSDDQVLQTSPCGYALVTKGLWVKTGGFPVESAIGAPDSIFVSILMRNMSKALVGVAGGAPLVNYRRHNDSDTGTRPLVYQGPIFIVRDYLTTNWKAPPWTTNR